MNNITSNSGSVDPTLNPLLYQTETEPTLAPVKREQTEDVIESANTAPGVMSQLHLVPVLPRILATWNGPVTPYTLETQSGKQVVIAPPNRFNDMLSSADQLVRDGSISSNGTIPYADLLKKIQDAIHMLTDELESQSNQSNQVDKEFHKTSLATYEEIPSPFTQASNKPTTSETPKKKLAKITKEAALDTGNTQSVQGMLGKLLSDSKIDPKISDQILALGQLQYLQKNASKNASGGVIIGNNPEVMILLQKLGISLPKPNPNAPFAGMALELASKNKPPYNDPAYKALAESLPKGWEVITLPDLQALIQHIALDIRQTAGKSYGILAKPLQGLFGSALFSLNEGNRGNVDDVKALVNLKKLLEKFKKESAYNSYGQDVFIKKYQKEFDKYVDKGLIDYSQTPQGIMNSSFSPMHNSSNNYQIDSAIESFQNKINQLGGVEILTNKDPPADPNGLGRLASGAVIGGMTDSISNILNSLFEKELTNSFNNSSLPVKDKKNIQNLASLTILTTVLGDALHANPVMDGKDAHGRLEKAINSIKDSGQADNVLKAVFNTADGSALTDYQTQVLQQATQAFMINVGAISITSTAAGVNAPKAFNALSTLKSSQVGEDVKSAQAFWETQSATLSDATKFNELAKKIAPNADSSSESIESQNQIREMIKLLKKILEQLLSGGQSSQQFGAAISKVKEGLGFLNMAGFTQDIHG